MTDAEIFPFMATLRDVIRVFPVRGDESDVQQLGAAYFKALRRYPLTLVQAGADHVVAHNKHFPKPAEWLDAIPRSASTSGALEALSVAEADDWMAAERGRWQQPACRCVECRAAGVADQPQRFVPNIDANGADLRGLIGERAVTRGRWIHGDELARWYAAKAEFWRLFNAAAAGLSMTREPGQEG